MISRNLSTQQSKPKFQIQSSKLESYAEHAIKKSNVKKFVNSGSLILQNVVFSNDQAKNLSIHLLGLKSTCNDLKKNILNKENDATKLKDETSFTFEKVKLLNNQREQFELRIAKITRDLQQIHNKKQVTTHTHKTYENMLWRMKKDEITNQIRKNHLTQQLSLMQKQMKELEKKLYAINEYEQMSINGLDQARTQIMIQNQKRNTKMTEMNQFYQDKQLSQIKKLQRLDQTMSIQSMAAGDLQDVNLIRLKKFLQAQKFLRCMLKHKMDKLKGTYAPYELAFFKIKSETSVKDSCSLKSEFFSFEQKYQERTIFIKLLEDKVQKLQTQQKLINAQLIEVKQIELDLIEKMQLQIQMQTQNSNSNSNQNQQNNRYNDVPIKTSNIIRKSDEYQLKMMQINQWISTQYKAISLSNNISANSKVHQFKLICDALINKKQNSQKNEPQHIHNLKSINVKPINKVEPINNIESEPIHKMELVTVQQEKAKQQQLKFQLNNDNLNLENQREIETIQEDKKITERQEPPIQRQQMQ